MAASAEHTDIQSFIAETRQTLTEIKTALVGNPLANDGGMVGRLGKVEKDVEEMKPVKFYQRVMWTGLGMVVTSIIAYVLSVALKH